MTGLVKQTAPDPLLVQVLAGQDAWAKLSKSQRALVKSHRTLIDATTDRTSKRYAISAAPVTAAPRTLESLRAKGVIDDDDRLTWVGCYALLWGCPDPYRIPLPEDGPA